MQRYRMYSVKDVVAASFSPPFCVRVGRDAVEMFTNAVNDPNPDNMLRKHPGDFELWYIGEFEDLGVVAPVPLERIAVGVDVIMTV